MIKMAIFRFNNARGAGGRSRVRSNAIYEITTQFYFTISVRARFICCTGCKCDDNHDFLYDLKRLNPGVKYLQIK